MFLSAPLMYIILRHGYAVGISAASLLSCFRLMREYMFIFDAEDPEMRVNNCLLTITNRQNMEHNTDAAAYIKSRIQCGGHERKSPFASVLSQIVHILPIRRRQVWEKLWILVQRFGGQMLFNDGQRSSTFLFTQSLFFAKRFPYCAYESDFELCLGRLARWYSQDGIRSNRCWQLLCILLIFT